MYKRHIGDCLNCWGGICSTGKYQNYCCPYQWNPMTAPEHCTRYTPITPEMLEQWETKGCIIGSTVPAWEGIGEPAKK